MVLLIGYGNELRGDDAAGPRVAAAVKEWMLPYVRSLSVHQLTPELAEPISQARAVIFVDAALAADDSQTTTVALQPCREVQFQAHSSDPRALLAFARILYGSTPPAWLVKIPAVSFELGQALSAAASNGVDRALAELRTLLASFQNG